MNPTFDIKACGIPCQVEVQRYRPGAPATHWDPAEPDEIEWVLLDRRGRRAEWLERKLSAKEEEEIEAEAIRLMDEAIRNGYLD